MARRAAASPDAYPPGRWRILSFEQRYNLVLFLSHILVRHKNSLNDGSDIAFRAIDWAPDPAPPERTREEAKQVAHEIADALASAPQDFGLLARIYSEDSATRERDGSLGGVRASQLASSILDALEQTPLSTTTRVVETAYGFHIFMRRPPPQARIVAGERIVVRYRGCVESELFGVPSRSRLEALTRARTLAQNATGEDFAHYVRAFSENVDRLHDGDMGAWSTVAPDGNGPEIEVLSALRVGELSQPIDTPFGFQIIKATARTSRERLAVDLIRLPYDARANESATTSRSSVELLANDLLAQLQLDPSQFDRLRSQFSKDDRVEWNQGRGHPRLEDALLPVSIGDVATAVIDIDGFKVVARRTAPEMAGQRAGETYDFPHDPKPDLNAILKHTSGVELAKAIPDLKADARAALQLAAADQAVIDRALDAMEQELRMSETALDRVNARARLRSELEGSLSASSFARVRAFIEHWVAARLVDQSLGS